MEKTRKILKSPSVKRRSRITPLNQRVTLERVIGLTATNNATLTCDANSGTIAYPAGCVVVLFNPRRTKQSHILNFSKKTLTAVAFSQDGKHIVTGESGHQPAVRVWNVEEKSQVSELHGHKFGINCVDSLKMFANVRGLQTMQITKDTFFDQEENFCSLLAFSPNLKYLVSIGSQHDMMVNVWNWKTGTKVASNKISSKVNAVAFSEDSSMFVTVGNRHVKFWYLDSSKSRVNETVPLLGRSGILGEQKNNFFADVVCGKGKGPTSKLVFTITQSGLLCQFNEKRLLDKWVELRTTSASSLTVGEKNIFIGCANGTVRVFSAQTLHYVATLPHPHSLGVDVSSALSPSQMVCHNEDAKYPDTVAIVFDDIHKKVTCIYNDHSLYMWDVHDMKKVGKAWSFLYHSSCVWGLELAPPVQEGQTPVLPPGSFITCSSDDTIRIWNLDPHMQPTDSYKRNVFSNELLKILYVDPSHSSLKNVDYNPAGGTDKTDTNYDGKNGIRSVCMSPDGRHLASGDRIGNVRIHDLDSMKELHSIEAHDGEVLCLEYSRVKTGPKILSSTSRDRLVHVFDVEQNYGLLQTLDDHSASITAVKFTDNDNQLKMLSCGADKSLLFRSAQMSPEFQFTLSQHLVGKTTLYDMDIDPTQKFVATACQDRNIRIYNIKTAKQKRLYKGSVGDDGTLIRIKLDPSGSYAVTTCTDKNLCVLDYGTGELMATNYGHSEVSTGVRFTNDLKHIISVSGDGCIFVWRLSPEMTRQMQGRLEAQAMNDTVTLDASMPSDQDFKTPTKILEELTRENQLREKQTEDTPVDYRYSVGQLPKWAKSKVGDDKQNNEKDDQGTSQPQGRWAQRVDNKGILAQVDGKTIQLDLASGVTSDRHTRRNVPYDDVDCTADPRRETMVLSKPENTPRKIPVIIDDENNDDDDDEDFFPSFHKKLDDDFKLDDSYKSRSSDQIDGRNLWSKRSSYVFNRSNSQDDLDDFDLDTNEPEVIYYPPSEVDSTDSNGTSYTVFAGTADTHNRFRKSNLKPVGSEKSLDGDSESTDSVPLEDVDDDDDSLSIPSNPATPSDDTPLKTPDREKFFESSLSMMENDVNSSQDNFSRRLSISSRFLSRAQQANIRNMSVYNSIQRQDNWFDFFMKGILGHRLHAYTRGFYGHRLLSYMRRLQSVQKRKDEMARAVDETRKRLLAMGWKDQSPEAEPVKENLPSPPVKLKPSYEDEVFGLNYLPEEKTPTNKALSTSSGSSFSNPQSLRSPLRRCWSSLDLPKTPIIEEKPRLSYSTSTPSTPLFKSPHGKKLSAIPTRSGNSAAAKKKPSWRSRIPTPSAFTSRHNSPRPISNRESIWDVRSECSDDDPSFKKTPTNSSSPVAPPRGRKIRPKTLTLDPKQKQDGSESDHSGRTTPKTTPRSHSQCSMHRRLTESSKAKISKSTSSSNLLAKEDKKDTPKSSTNTGKSSSMQNLSGNRMSLSKSKSKLKSTKLSSMYTSTPNLAKAFDSDVDEIESSNLKLSSRLSGSVPDLLDEPSLNDSKPVSVNKEPSHSKRFSMGTAKKIAKNEQKTNSSTRTARLSLPANANSGRIDGEKATKSSFLKKDDKNLMPPPSSSSIVRGKAEMGKSRQDAFQKRAVQSKRRPGSELTLDQAKDILMGKSGILGSGKSSESADSASVVSDSSENSDVIASTNSYSSATSTFPTYTMASAATSVYTTASVVTSPSSYHTSTTSSTTISSSDPFLNQDTKILTIASEIESTAAEIRRKNAIENAFQNLSVLDASPNDLPERDMAPTQLVSSVPNVSATNSKPSVKSSYSFEKNKLMNNDWCNNQTSQSSLSSGVDGDEDEDLPPTASIKDRIALLTSHGPSSPLRTSSPRMTSTAQLSVSTTPTRTQGYSVKSDTSPSASVLSPRSSSGIGSSLDSDAAIKLFTSPGSSLSPQSNYDLASVDLHTQSEEDSLSKYSPSAAQSMFTSTSELDFSSSKNISLADALEAVSSGNVSSDSPTLPSSAPPTNSKTLSNCSTPSSVISNMSTVVGSPRSNVTPSPRSNITQSPRSNATGSPRSNMNASPVTNGYIADSPRKPENLQDCMEAVKDLRQALKKVTDLYEKINCRDERNTEVVNLMEQALKDTHKTVGDTLSNTSQISKTPSDNSVSLDNLEPVLSSLSEQISDRVYHLLSKKLKDDVK